MERLPSAAILRQRIQEMPAGRAISGFTFTGRLLSAHPEYMTEAHHGDQYMTIHIDVSPMDNSGSHKEGVFCTYKNVAGYAPIFAYAGFHGFMLDNQLRPGKNHCNCEGTTEWFGRVRKPDNS